VQKSVIANLHSFKEQQNVQSHIGTFSKSENVQSENVRLPNPGWAFAHFKNEQSLIFSLLLFLKEQKSDHTFCRSF